MAKAVTKQINSIENRLSTCREYMRLWQEYFKFFADGFEDKTIYEKDEQAFFQIVNVLALNHFRFEELAGEFFKDGEATLKLLTETTSLEQIKEMSDAQFGKLLVDWHTLFISMNKAIGKLMLKLPAPKEDKKAKQAAAA